MVEDFLDAVPEISAGGYARKKPRIVSRLSTEKPLPNRVVRSADSRDSNSSP
jgi:hypothetical protein